MLKLTSMLYRTARRLRDAEVLFSGSPKKMGRRAKNKWLGRKVFRRINRW